MKSQELEWMKIKNYLNLNNRLFLVELVSLYLFLQIFLLKEIQLSILYEDQLNRLIKYNIIMISDKAKKLLNVIENNKNLDIARVYKNLF